MDDMAHPDLACIRELRWRNCVYCRRMHFSRRALYCSPCRDANVYRIRGYQASAAARASRREGRRSEVLAILQAVSHVSRIDVRSLIEDDRRK